MAPSKTLNFVIAGLALLAVDYCLAGKSKTLPITSKEEIQFLHKDDQGPMNFTKSKDFIGNIGRRDAPVKDSTLIDVYTFPDVSIRKLDEPTCLKLVDRVFGLSTQISLERSGTEVSQTPRSGNICEVTMLDKDSQAKFPERRFYARLINEKVYGFVFKKNSATPNAAFAEDAKKFVIELR